MPWLISVGNLKKAAQSSFDGLKASINAEKDRISSIVNNANSAKNAVDIAINTEKDRLKQSLDERLNAIKAQADAEKTAQDSN